MTGWRELEGQEPAGQGTTASHRPMETLTWAGCLMALWSEHHRQMRKGWAGVNSRQRQQRKASSSAQLGPAAVPDTRCHDPKPRPLPSPGSHCKAFLRG